MSQVSDIPPTHNKCLNSLTQEKTSQQSIKHLNVQYVTYTLNHPWEHQNPRESSVMESLIRSSILHIRVLTILFRSVEFKLRNSKEKLPNDKNLPPGRCSHVNLFLSELTKMRVSRRRYIHSMFVETAARMDSPERWSLGAKFPVFSLTRCKFHILYTRRKSFGEIRKGKVMEKLKNCRAMDTPSSDFQFGCKLIPKLPFYRPRFPDKNNSARKFTFSTFRARQNFIAIAFSCSAHLPQYCTAKQFFPPTFLLKNRKLSPVRLSNHFRFLLTHSSVLRAVTQLKILFSKVH